MWVFFISAFSVRILVYRKGGFSAVFRFCSLAVQGANNKFKKVTNVKKFIFILSIFALCAFAAADGAVLKSGKKVTAASNFSSGDFYESETAAVLSSGGGYIAEFDKNFDIDDFAKTLNAKKVAEFKNGSYVEFYYYTAEIPKFVIVGGKKVNLHFVKEDFRTVAGAPFIYSGY